MFEEKTVAELRELAKENGVTGRWDMNKAQLISALEECFENKSDTKAYVDRAKNGDLVAFKRKHDSEAALTGKLSGTDDRGRFVITTKNGIQYIVPRDNIIWVKTGRRWPKWIFKMFKSESNKKGDNYGEQKDRQACE